VHVLILKNLLHRADALIGACVKSNRGPICWQSSVEIWPLGPSSELRAVQGLGKLTDRIPHIQANPCSKTSERRKDSIHSPTNSGQSFRVMDAPEIYQVTGPVVVGEFLTAIQASNVASSRADRPTSGKSGWDRLAQGYRGTFMSMKTNKNKTKQCP